MKPVNPLQLSKTISHALRHAPGDYGLTLDVEGWVALADLVAALRGRRWDASEQDIFQIVEQAEKKRFQIVDGRIRAYYGHSTETKIVKQPQMPPALLYHGTVMSSHDSIMQHGLKPMERQYVHLSADVPTAKMVAGRREGEQIIFEVLAQEAHRNDIQFYEEANGIWLADEVPVEYVRLKYLKDKHVLIGSDIEGYSIVTKGWMFALIDDANEATRIINDLLLQGAEIFNDMQAFKEKYPPSTLTFEEKRAQAIKDTDEWLGEVRNTKGK